MGRKVKIGISQGPVDEKGRSFLLPTLAERLNEMADVECEVISALSPEVLPEEVVGFDILVEGGPSRWTQKSLPTDSQLLCLAKLGVGYDKIDISALTQAGIMLTITPDAVRRPVAVGIITFILTLSTRLLIKDRLVREGRWQDRWHYLGYGITGKTLGSVGVGNIGHEMFRLARPFGMRHIAYDPYVTQEMVADVDVKLVDLDTVLAESDFLSISCPLNETTRHLIAEKELAKMKKTAFLVNTARGPIVDEVALLNALREERIAGVGLDVFDQEPTPSDNPLLKLGVDKVIFSPHAVAHTNELSTFAEAQIMRQAKQIMAGEAPEALVNQEVLDSVELQSKFRSLKELLSSSADRS